MRTNLAFRFPRPHHSYKSGTAKEVRGEAPAQSAVRCARRTWLGKAKTPAYLGLSVDSPVFLAGTNSPSMESFGVDRPEEVSGKKRRLERMTALSSADQEAAAGNGGLLPMRVEEIVAHPLPGCEAPTGLSFSPDDQRIAFLFSADGTLHHQVFVLDTVERRQELLFTAPDGGGLEEGNLSADERLRRERSRERGLGVTYYEWRFDPASGRDGIVVPLPSGVRTFLATCCLCVYFPSFPPILLLGCRDCPLDDVLLVYFQDLCGSEPELKLPSTPSSPIIDPHLSPNGSMIAFTRGLAEYIAQEEMERKTGIWWSPDSKKLAFTEVDSSEVPLYRIMHQGKNYTGPNAQEDHAYPFAGEANAKVRLGVVPSHGGEITWMDILCGDQNKSNGGKEGYLGRVIWMHNGALAVQIKEKTIDMKTALFGPVRRLGSDICIFMEMVELVLHLLHKVTGCKVSSCDITLFTD
ncbi:hypothetical protein PR202_gb22929 [Eleusine coracana subsp. coracana]|uniref:Dipeptidylpeptidase IV N-terminal domain-containing protein n=1 Tax=Eleusine coracana subsp. coracana TaxID=191504 RepID=A0AAV5FH18_ELECO|nr:hypothetical protein PR202_gb22929 [Eleusine coracana subsp. coracana]